ncbi:MAG: acyl-CoA-binding protein [Myxococcaceae bacterium]|nr:MAG: acyl-CoA-binding protein [Myxococcaceae bacterium]
MSLTDDFNAAAARMKGLPQRPSNDELLQAYGLYKQGTEGDVNTAQPWAVQLEARAKWDAWSSRKGMTQDTAKEQYVALVDVLAAKYG